MSSPEESSTSELFGIERRLLGVLVTLETLRIVDLDEARLLVCESFREAKKESVNCIGDAAVRGRGGSKKRNPYKASALRLSVLPS